MHVGGGTGGAVLGRCLFDVADLLAHADQIAHDLTGLNADQVQQQLSKLLVIDQVKSYVIYYLLARARDFVALKLACPQNFLFIFSFAKNLIWNIANIKRNAMLVHPATNSI